MELFIGYNKSSFHKLTASHIEGVIKEEINEEKKFEEWEIKC